VNEKTSKNEETAFACGILIDGLVPKGGLTNAFCLIEFCYVLHHSVVFLSKIDISSVRTPRTARTLRTPLYLSCSRG